MPVTTHSLPILTLNDDARAAAGTAFRSADRSVATTTSVMDKGSVLVCRASPGRREFVDLPIRLLSRHEDERI